VIQEFAKVLRDKLREDMNSFTDSLAEGACRSFDEYQKACGVIHGLALAERHLLDLLKHVEDDPHD
jgi:hypothetical protein